MFGHDGRSPLRLRFHPGSVGAPVQNPMGSGWELAVDRRSGTYSSPMVRRGRADRRRVLAAAVLLAISALALSACIPPAPGPRVVTYSIAVDGGIWSDVNQFATVAAQTYADPRGWSGAGIEFRRVDTGGDFTLVLAEGTHLPNYDPVCTSDYSCQVGRYVVINDGRYAFGSPNWPGPLDDYRHMVINHETGHWLGLGHQNCPAPGAPAPVMQQQSISMQGCAVNPWPLPSEIAAVRR